MLDSGKVSRFALWEMKTAVIPTKTLTTKYHLPATGNFIFTVLIESETEHNYMVRHFSRTSMKGYSVETVSRKGIKLYETFEEAKAVLVERNRSSLLVAKAKVTKAELELAESENYSAESAHKY